MTSRVECPNCGDDVWCNICGEPYPEPDFRAMAEEMPRLIDVAAWWTENNRIELARKLWRAGTGAGK